MNRSTLAAVPLVLLLAACGAATDAGSAPATVPASPAASKATTPAASGDWKFAQVTVKTTYGVAMGTMRATNITGDKRSGLFTVTAFDKGGKVLGTLSGAANDVAANTTVTVQLLGTDALKGAVRYEVQVDGSF